MSPTPVLLEADGLSTGYGARTVLSGVRLTVQAGDFWFFLGPNGEGKTTLVRTLLGTLRPRQGRLERNVGAGQVGFVPQRCDFNPSLPMTVREFVLLGLAGLRVPRAEEDGRLAGALTHVNLGGFEGRDYWSLSGGQRQRVLGARALVRRPRLLFLDEPTNGLDPAAEAALLDGLLRINREDGLTIIFVTHFIALAARAATHIALFREGAVVAGPKAQTFTDAELSRTYKVDVAVAAEPDGTVRLRVGGQT
jgi:ABC-type Mn2+/Zn2+ transport system ATPase subunit